MKTERIAGRLIVRDNPTAFWAFYSFFVMGGITALYLFFVRCYEHADGRLRCVHRPRKHCGRYIHDQEGAGFGSGD